MTINFANTVELTKLSGKHRKTKITTGRDFSQVSKVNRWLFSRTCISCPYPREIRTCRRTQLRTQSEALVLPLKIIRGAMRAWTCNLSCLIKGYSVFSDFCAHCFWLFIQIRLDMLRWPLHQAFNFNGTCQMCLECWLPPSHPRSAWKAHVPSPNLDHHWGVLQSGPVQLGGEQMHNLSQQLEVAKIC